MSKRPQQEILDEIQDLEKKSEGQLKGMTKAFKSYAQAQAAFYKNGKPKLLMRDRLRLKSPSLLQQLMKKDQDWLRSNGLQVLKETYVANKAEAMTAISEAAKMLYKIQNLQKEESFYSYAEVDNTSKLSYEAQLKNNLTNQFKVIVGGGRKNRRRKSRRRKKSTKKKRRRRKKRSRRRRK